MFWQQQKKWYSHKENPSKIIAKKTFLNRPNRVVFIPRYVGMLNYTMGAQLSAALAEFGRFLLNLADSREIWCKLV